jgi:hypothetical protein
MRIWKDYEGGTPFPLSLAPLFCGDRSQEPLGCAQMNLFACSEQNLDATVTVIMTVMKVTSLVGCES